jgi:predicted transcriptional regulator
MPIPPDDSELSRRERQTMDLLIKRETATARQIQEHLPDPPSYSAVRSILRILCAKKLITKVPGKGRDIYSPVLPVKRARVNALHAIVKKFFADSAVEAACALLGDRRQKLSADDARRLQKLIDEARRS